MDGGTIDFYFYLFFQLFLIFIWEFLLIIRKKLMKKKNFYNKYIFNTKKYILLNAKNIELLEEVC